MRETKVALDNDNIKLSVPLFKVDTERRIVHGFATVDNLDKQADIVTRDASIKAFELINEWLAALQELTNGWIFKN